jgi:hypothetical protein
MTRRDAQLHCFLKDCCPFNIQNPIEQLPLSASFYKRIFAEALWRPPKNLNLRIPLTDADRTELARLLRVRPADRTFQRTIDGLIISYGHFKSFARPSKKLRKKLELAARAAAKMTRALHELGPLLPVVLPLPGIAHLESIEVAFLLSEKIAEGCRVALREKFTGGRPEDRLNPLISKLIDLFEKRTGRAAAVTTNPSGDAFGRGAAYGGGLFIMVRIVTRAVAEAAGEKPKSNTALARLIQRELERRRTSDQKPGQIE